MAALYGRLQGNRGQVTRCGSRIIDAKLETWNGSIRVALMTNGDFRVSIGDKFSPHTTIATGNVDAREWTPMEVDA